MSKGSDNLVYTRYTGDGFKRIEGSIIREMPLALYVNQKELVTLLCTPLKLNCLVLGFLYMEGLIKGLDEVVMLRICEEEGMADIRLSDDQVRLPERRVLTSGCGGGTTFIDLASAHAKLDSSLTITPHQIFQMMRRLQQEAELYRATGGIHTSALSDGDELLVIAEDVGRHNTLDKIQGECLLRGISTKDRIILTTGRISSEMLVKTAKMDVPMIVSRTSPTNLAVKLAREWGLTLIGYARGRRMNVYAGGECLFSNHASAAFALPLARSPR